MSAVVESSVFALSQADEVDGAGWPIREDVFSEDAEEIDDYTEYPDENQDEYTDEDQHEYSAEYPDEYQDEYYEQDVEQFDQFDQFDEYDEVDQFEEAGDVESAEFDTLEHAFETPLDAQSFPSGLILNTRPGPTGHNEEHWDPNNTGLPLYDTGPDIRKKKLATNFTVAELVTSGGRPADRARISPALVSCLQAIRDRAGRPVKIGSGYRSWANNVALYRARGKKPTLSRHCSGQAADITITGMTGIQIAKLAIDTCGNNIGIGIANTFAHIDVRGKPDTWTYFTGTQNTNTLNEINKHRKNPNPTPTPTPTPTPNPTRGGVRAGSHVIKQLPMLSGHAGSPPDLLLEWNDTSATSVVDVVVHLHGFAGQGKAMNIQRHKKPISGLDFADPANPSTVGRRSPTLFILPRGHHQPESTYGYNSARYVFPALVKPGALQQLIAESLAEFSRITGVTVRQGRLILTAHSGGGAAALAILGHTNPDEVILFDALYNDPANLIMWAKRAIASGSGALRVLYRPYPKSAAKSPPWANARNSERVAEAVRAAAMPTFRVESTSVDHNSIPRQFGWRLLADPAANLPDVSPVEGFESEIDDEDWTPQEGDGEYWGQLEADEFDEFAESADQEFGSGILNPANVARTVQISDYPRYATTVNDLRPDQVDELRSLCNEIVVLLRAGQQVGAVVEGFADFDTKGRDFELQVSIDRAMSARNFIVEEVHRIAQASRLGAEDLRRFSIQVAAFGSRRPTVSQPMNEDQRRQNRRIHVVLHNLPVPPAPLVPFDQALDKAQRALPHVRKPGPQRRLTCMVAKLRDSRTADGYFSYDALKMFPGSAGWPSMSSTQFDLMVKATTQHTRPQIQSMASATRDDAEMAVQLELLDDNIGRNIFNFESQLVGDSSTGMLMRTFNATIGRLQADPTSILSCYSGYARIRHDQ